jgi:hypothetical protein
MAKRPGTTQSAPRLHAAVMVDDLSESSGLYAFGAFIPMGERTAADMSQ